MKRVSVFFGLLFPLFSSAATLAFTGDARTLKGDTLLYRESHTIEGECESGVFRPLEHQVIYTQTSGKEFARKSLDYRASPLRPSVTFLQPDFSEEILIQNRDERALDVKWISPEGTTETSVIDVEPLLVADSGFDNLVRQQWNNISAFNDVVEFEFLAPTRGTSYGFDLKRIDDDRIKTDYVVQIRPSSTIISLLVDPILLGYDANGYLTDYLGLTNIRKDKDGNHTAHIRYSRTRVPDCPLIG